MTQAANFRTIQEDLILSPKQLKEIFLFGVNFQDDDGNEYPEEMFEFYIRSAQQWLEATIPGLKLTTETITNEVHDYRLGDYIQYNFIKLFRYPVQDVSRVAIQFPLSQNTLEFDPSWYRAEAMNGQLMLFPTQGTFSSIVLSQGGSYVPLIYSGVEWVPHILHVDYKAGFPKGKIPTSIQEVIGMKAAIPVLNIAGELVAGAGIASKSLSIDGLSQSIGTTASAMNTGYGARIIEYNKEIKDYLHSLRSTYSGLQMVVA